MDESLSKLVDLTMDTNTLNNLFSVLTDYVGVSNNISYVRKLIDISIILFFRYDEQLLQVKDYMRFFLYFNSTIVYVILLKITANSNLVKYLYSPVLKKALSVDIFPLVRKKYVKLVVTHSLYDLLYFIVHKLYHNDIELLKRENSNVLTSYVLNKLYNFSRLN